MRTCEVEGRGMLEKFGADGDEIIFDEERMIKWITSQLFTTWLVV